MPRSWRIPAWWLVLIAISGCTQSEPPVDPAVLAAHRERLVLGEEPDGAVGVLEVREMLAPPAEAEETSVGDPSNAADSAAPPTDLAAGSQVPPEMVVVVGRIGGIPNPWKQARPDYPWLTGQAEFVIADAAAAAEIEDHGHAHDDPDHECPFCAAAADSNVVAVVRFKDKSGKVIAIDAKELFDLKGDETVVVRGKPEILGDAKDGVLLVEADGLYVRR
jgi:hypothetical protein